MRMYRALLHCYPRSFRAEYGAEMCAVLGRRLHGTSHAGSRALVWLDAVLDVIRNTAGLHFDLLAQDLRQTLRGLELNHSYQIREGDPTPLVLKLHPVSLDKKATVRHGMAQVTPNETPGLDRR